MKSCPGIPAALVRGSGSDRGGHSGTRFRAAGKRAVERPFQAIAQVDTSAIESRVTAEVTARLQSEMAAAVNNAVTKAVADTEKRDDLRTAQLLSASDRRYSDAADFLDKQVTRIYALNTGAGVR